MIRTSSLLRLKVREGTHDLCSVDRTQKSALSTVKPNPLEGTSCWRERFRRWRRCNLWLIVWLRGLTSQLLHTTNGWRLFVDGTLEWVVNLQEFMFNSRVFPREMILEVCVWETAGLGQILMILYQCFSLSWEFWK